MRKIPRSIIDRVAGAAQPISQRGLNATTIDEIVAATGIPKATLYYYFDGKEAILAFLLEDVLRELSEELSAAESTKGTGAERLHRVIAAQLRVMARRPAVCRALLGELNRAATMPAISEMLVTAYAQPVEAVLLAGASDGSTVAQHDSRAAAVALLGAVTATAMISLVAEEQLDEDLVAATIGSVIFEGLRPR